MTFIIVRFLAVFAIFASVFLISQISIGFVLNRKAKMQSINERLRHLQAGVDKDEVAHRFRKNAPLFLADDASYRDRANVSFHRMFVTAGVPGDPQKLLIACAGASVAIVFVLMILALSSGIQMTFGAILLMICMSLALAIGLPLMVISRLAQRRRKRMEEQFPVAIDIFTRALRAGHPVAGAISLITEEMEDPIGSEFGLVADEVDYGADLNDALLAMAERWDMEDIRMFVISLSVQSETGGNLTEILSNLTKVIRARASMFMKVRALSSEGRMSAWMLTALPIFTLVIILLANPTFYFGVANDPIFAPGFSLLLGLYVIGVLIIRRMVDLKV